MPTWLTGNLIKAIVILALLASIVWGANHYVEGEREAGKAECRAEYTLRDNKALKDAQAEVERYRLREAEGAAVQATIVANLKKDYDEEIAKRDRYIGGIRSGAIVLRDPNAKRPACSGAASTVTSTTSGNNGETGSELPKPTAEFLSSEASRADKIVKQLQACQAELINDRKIVNGGNP